MRKVLIELILLAIAVGLTVEIIKSAIPYLPFMWLLIFAHYTWEAASSDYALRLTSKLKARLSGKTLMYSYGLVAIFGAALFTLYWWGLQSFFAPRIAAYQAEQRGKKSTGESDSRSVPQLQSPGAPTETSKSSDPARAGSSPQAPKSKQITPTSPLPPQAENQKLINDALELARKIAQLQEDCFNEIRNEQDKLRKEFDAATTDEERRNVTSRITAAAKVVSWRALGFYKDRYQRDAIAVRDALLSKLPKGSRMEGVESMYDNAVMCVDFSAIADDLRRLARLMQAEIK